jgi:hypothetical protein
MTPTGYIASLTEQIRHLNLCEHIVTFMDNGLELKTYVKPQHIEWYMEYLPNKGHKIVSVETLDKNEIPAIARRIVDRMAARMYGYKHVGAEINEIHG